MPPVGETKADQRDQVGGCLPQSLALTEPEDVETPQSSVRGGSGSRWAGPGRCSSVEEMRGRGRGPQGRPLVVTVELSLAGPGRQGTGCLVTTRLSPSLAGSA